MPDDTVAESGPDLQGTGDPPRQRATWAELFVDLVWVFAVTEIAGTLAASHGLGQVARTLLLFVPLWWGWVGVTLLGNASGAALDTARGRLTLFLLAGCALGMTVAIPAAYQGQGLLFAGCYLALRCILWAEMHRHPVLRGRWVEPFFVSMTLSAPLFVVGGLLHGPWRLGLWAVAALIGVFNPTLLGRRFRGFRVQTEHLPERFGLFLIIALGETVVAVGGQAAGSSLDAVTLVTLVLGFFLIVSLWWSYFHYGAPAAQHSLETDAAQARIVRDVFSYLHFLLIVGIICVAVGLKKLLAHPLDEPHTVAELLLAPGAAVYLLGFCFARWRMFGAVGLPRFVGMLACVALAALATLMPALAVAALVTAVVVGVNVTEAWLINTGRHLLLLHLPHRRARQAASAGER
ncbi:MAG: low temperature requirement protein A [Pseudonocardiales bacterium]|nr:MAG: low temperature requirement protein A [Pseudonocardiales bacterium]